MNTKENKPILGLANFHGILVFLITAFLAEIVLGNFLEGESLTWSAGVGRILIVFLSLYTIHRFASFGLSNYKATPKDLVCLSLIIFGALMIGWLGKVLAIGLSTYTQQINYLSGVSRESFSFMVPYAAGAFLIQAVLGLHYGLVFAISLSIIIGVYNPGEPLLVPFVLVTSLVGCLSLYSFRSRAAYIKAGLNISLIAIPFVMVSIIVVGLTSPADVTIRLLGALLGGILCTFIAAGVSPIIENFGGYVTDMRLLEMATLDHPLLKELSVQAPGTWNHSMVMGMMVEAAADSVGANPILARVGAYFHDIGKMKKPLYFVENQFGGENRHDKLSTSMSALIIRSHVKDGMELARKHKLPKAIEDMIPQHHGTSLIEYFYDKAVKDAEEAGESIEIDSSLYSYPGPKPQTKEAGILMLADGIEAAARTLTDHTVDRIQGMVQKMINKVFASGELDECELTLKELHLIAKAFTRVLTGIYHQRITYAEPAEKVSEKGQRPEIESAPTEENGTGEEAPAKEDLKRLGL